MQIKKLSLLLCASAAFWGTSALVHSTDAILVRKSGAVEIRSGKSKVFKEARAGDPMLFGDTVRTLKDAKAQILFPNGNAILIKESASLKLSGKIGSVSCYVQQGEFLIGIKKKLAQGKSFRVRTPAAVASVRGTLFWGLSDQDLNSHYACFQEKLEISAKGKTVVLNPGEKILIPYGKPPQKKQPADVPLDYIDTFEIDGSVEGLKEMAGENK